jgi:preprotein translocase subunit YajC
MIGHDILIQGLAVLAVLILGYVFLVRPQLKRVRENEKLLASLQVGDTVVTIGGLIGTIKSIEGPRLLEIELSDTTRIRALRHGIESKFEE